MNNELFSRLKDLAQKENRTRLAVLLGAAAMLLILLSELFTPSGKTAAASAAAVGGVNWFDIRILFLSHCTIQTQ